MQGPEIREINPVGKENKKAQLSLTNPRDAFWRIVVYGVGVFVCVNV